MSEDREFMRIIGGTWRWIIWAILVLGIVLFVGGVVVAFAGNQAETALTLFGQELSTTSVGVALAFIGVVMVVLTLRGMFGSIRDFIRARGTDPNSHPPA